MGLQTVRQLSAVVLSAVVGCAISTANAAENYYKWVDQYGTTQYTQTPPPASARKTYKRVSVSTHVPADVRNRAAAPPVESSTKPPVNSSTPASAPEEPTPVVVSNDDRPPANQ
jgi:hypothetical protein